MKMLIDSADRQDFTTVTHVQGEALVKIRTGFSEQFASKLFLRGLTIHKKMNLLAGDFAVIQSPFKSIFSLIEMLNELPEVEYAEPNYTSKITGISEPQSNPKNPWEKFVAKEAAIEVIDSSIDLNFPIVKPDIKVNRKRVQTSQSGGFAEEITIRDLLFLSNKVPVNLAEAVEAIDYATKMKVNIVSNSWVRDGFSKALDEAINIADKKGISFVAAASIAATIGTSLGAVGGYSPATQYDLKSMNNETKSSARVTAGVLSLYIAQEGNVEKTGRGRLIARSAPSDEEILNQWNSDSLHQNTNTSSVKNDIKITQNYSFPGAKFIKLEIDKFNSDTNIDLIILKNAKGNIINNISASGESFETGYVETNLIIVEFTSNATSTSFGSVIRNVKVIY